MQDSPTIQQQPPGLTGIPDAQLLEAWVRDQRQADFTEIVRRHLGLVQGIARRQLDHDHAEDIAQQVFAILARKAASLGDLRSLSAWLHRVTLLQTRAAVRRRMRDCRNQEAAMENLRIADARDPLADALPHLDAAIGELSESDRELILLRYSEGLSFREAATLTGRKEAALRQQVSRAVEKLSAMLRRRGVFVHATTLTAGLGVHLVGNSTASAAALVSSTALSSASGISGLLLAGITFLTMTAKQSIITGAVLAALLAAGPLAWRASQVHQAEKFLAADSHASTNEQEEKTAGFDEISTRSVKTKSDRSAKPLSERDRQRMIGAIPEIFMASVKESMNDWFSREAWLEARRTARTLGLSSEMETELRDLLVAKYARGVATLDSDYKDLDRSTQLDAWFAAKLTSEQQQSRQRMYDARTAALTEKLATTAVQEISANIDLTDEQKEQFYETAAAKVTRSLEKEADSHHLLMGWKVLHTPIAPPVEEEASDLVSSMLDPGQLELWKVAVERDHSFLEDVQKCVLGGVFEQLEKVKPTHVEMFGPSEK